MKNGTDDFDEYVHNNDHTQENKNKIVYNNNDNDFGNIMDKWKLTMISSLLDLHYFSIYNDGDRAFFEDYILFLRVYLEINSSK